MQTAAAAEMRPYHHGDLRKALLEAGRRLLEVEGNADISLRAVAREAGVSPAAPYHHFRDKSELLDTLAMEGWDQLEAEMRSALAAVGPEGDRLVTMGVAYVNFARNNPAIYKVMFSCGMGQQSLPESLRDEGAFRLVCETLIQSGSDPTDQADLELSAVAVWCAAYGVAELAGFKEFAPLRAHFGGEEPFLRALFSRLDPFRTKTLSSAG
ncbi:MAG: TetR/AcrR family transcriptional regulator [Phenylobacterium sp.]